MSSILEPVTGAEGLTLVTPEHLQKFFGDDDVSTRGSAAWLARAKERALYRRSLYAFTKSVICYQESPNLMTAQSFKESCEWLQEALVEWKCGLFEDPRNHIKSTRTTVAIPPWLAIQYTDEKYDHPAEIARQKSWLEAHPAMRGVDTRIVIASEKEPKAKRWVGHSKAQWERNAYLRALFPEMLWETHGYNQYGRLPANECWTGEGYTLPGRRVSRRDPFVRAMGIRSGASGDRADCIFIDDLVSEDSEGSEPELEYRRNWFRSIQQLLEDPGTHRPDASTALLITNRWNFNDPNSVVHDQMDDWPIWRRAAWRCGVHGYGNCGRLSSDASEIECTPSDDPIWPERHKDLDAIRKRVGNRTFYIQWGNWPFEASDLDVESLKECRLERDGAEWWVIVPRQVRDGVAVTDSGHRQRVETLRHHFVSVDPASADEESAARKKGKTCRWSVAWYACDEQSGDVYCLGESSGHWSPHEALTNIFAAWREWSAIMPGLKILYEKVGAQTLGKEALRLKALELGVRPPTVELMPVRRGAGKITDIRQKIGWLMEQGNLYIRQGLTVPYSEIRQFPTGYKDWLDTLRQYIGKLNEVRNPAGASLTAQRRAAAGKRKRRNSQAGSTGAW